MLDGFGNVTVQCILGSRMFFNLIESAEYNAAPSEKIGSEPLSSLHFGDSGIQHGSHECVCCVSSDCSCPHLYEFCLEETSRLCRMSLVSRVISPQLKHCRRMIVQKLSPSSLSGPFNKLHKCECLPSNFSDKLRSFSLSLFRCVYRSESMLSVNARDTVWP